MLQDEGADQGVEAQQLFAGKCWHVNKSKHAVYCILTYRLCLADWFYLEQNGQYWTMLCRMIAPVAKTVRSPAWFWSALILDSRDE